MKQFKRNKISAVAAALGLAGTMLVSVNSVAAERMYAVDGSKGMVKNSAGECWLSSGGVSGPVEACGDAMSMPEVKAAAPAPVVVAAPADSDGDGVNDDRDRCPDTSAGAVVDADGCEIVENVQVNVEGGEFDFNSADLKPKAKAFLNNLVEKIKASPGNETVSVTGYTDSTGPEAYNLELSVRRAQAVADYMAAFGIRDITVDGKGEADPIADNGTKEGRAENRRVKLVTH
ncbi:MAG: OmpA family protein [Gammaproteobacteria bacterium]|nr:OmpA family protein [Gammaproteobacteria bacterium]